MCNSFSYILQYIDYSDSNPGKTMYKCSNYSLTPLTLPNPPHTQPYQKQRVAVGSNQLVDVEKDLVAKCCHIQVTRNVLHQLQKPGAAIAPAATVSPTSTAVATTRNALTHRCATQGDSLSVCVAQKRQ